MAVAGIERFRVHLVAQSAAETSAFHHKNLQLSSGLAASLYPPVETWRRGRLDAATRNSPMISTVTRRYRQFSEKAIFDQILTLFRQISVPDLQISG
jgi:hypothetical protein